MVAVLTGQLTVTVEQGSNIKHIQGSCKPFVLLKISSSDRTEQTAVKDGDTNPTWNERFTFGGVTDEDNLIISLMDKGQPFAGANDTSKVVGVSRIKPFQWGKRAYPSSLHLAFKPIWVGNDSSAGRAGEEDDDGRETGAEETRVRVSVEWEPVMMLRSPFKAVAWAAEMTGVVTEKANLDPLIGQAMDAIWRLVTFFLGLSRPVQVAGFVGFMAVCNVALMTAAVPAILFLPLTIIGTFVLLLAALFLLPMVSVIAWVLLCATPVRQRLWVPLVVKAVCSLSIMKMVMLESTIEKQPRHQGSHHQ